MESQQDDAARLQPRVPAPDRAEVARADRRRSLELQRTRVADDLSRASAPAHRQMLEAAITALDEQIAAL